jgi:hypothetical protein
MRDSFTLIDVLVGVALILIVFLGIFAAYQLGLKVVGLSKARIDATALANQWMEIIRNLPYESVGIVGAVLPYAKGTLDSSTSTIRNNIEYTIEIKVRYISDEADGLGQADQCDLDYKRAEVKVSWPGLFGGKISFVSDISPKNLSQEIQSCQAQAGGVLSVKVFDAYGVMLASPLIEIFNPTTGEKIVSLVSESGKENIPLATSTYKVVVSKNGYSSERTYGIEEVTIPEKPHPLVLEGQLTEISFSIDKLSSINVETRGSKGVGYPVIHNVTFNLRGKKLIGYDEQENPVYKYSQNHTTNGAGSVVISNLEWDSYYFSIITPGLNLMEIESPPGTTTTQPIALSPDTNLTVRLILSAENSLLVTVEDMEESEPIFSARLRLHNIDLGYDTTQYTDEEGQTYFIPLEKANYNLEVEGPGYAATSTTILVSGETKKTIKLEQIE